MGPRYDRWKRRQDNFNDRMYPILFWFVFPALAAFTLAFTVPAIGPTLRAAHGKGMPGSFTALRKDCGGRGGCSWYGRFDSTDGSVHFADVLIDGGVSYLGDVQAALYEGERHPPKVYRATNSHDWVFVFLLIAGAIAYLGAWTHALRRRRRGQDNWIDGPSF